MSEHSLPIQDDDISDHGSPDYDNLDYYIIRITPYDKFTYDDLKTFLADEEQFCEYVVAQEKLPQIHYHIVVSVDKSTKYEDLKGLVSFWIRGYWSDPVTGKVPRGYGNKQFNVQKCEDKDASVSYTLKDKNEYHFEGFSQQYIQERIEASFQKKKPSNFKQEYLQLTQDFQNSDMDELQFMTKYIILKADYGQQVRLSDAYGYALSNLIKREPHRAEVFVENYLYKL